MGISLEQYRAAVGRFCRVFRTCPAHGGLEPRLPGLRASWEAAALVLLLMVLSPTCLGSLLLIGGVESNPGPVTADSKRSVLAALCAGAPTAEIRDCLRCYDISKSASLIERKMGGISVPNLISTMTYLGVPGQECYVKATIIHNLVCRIENLLPDICSICDSEYTIAKDEVPLLGCAFCGQGIHSPCLLQLLEVSPGDQDSFGPEEVQRKINPCNLPGFFYICHCCEKEKVPSEDEGKKKSHSNRDENINENINHTNNERGATNPTRGDEGTVEDSVVDESETVSQENGNQTVVEDRIQGGQIASRQNRQTNQQHIQRRSSLPANPRMNPRQNGQRNEAEGEIRHGVEADRSPICSLYRKGTCRFGISGKGCSRSHPKPCRRIMQHGNKGPRGCSKGSNCSKFHPQICFSSLSRGECFNGKCTFPHIKGTRRLNTPATRSPDGRRPDRRTETIDTVAGANKTQHREDFLSAMAVLKRELIDSFDRKFQTLQAQIQQVGPADSPQFYPQTYRYPQRAVPHQVTQMPIY